MSRNKLKACNKGRFNKICISKKRKEEYMKQKQILSEEFSELLGFYFVCEKLVRDMTNITDSKKSIDLSRLKKVMQGNGIIMCDHDLDLLFNTNFKKKNPNKYSFRNIRNNVCHKCSFADRDHAVKFQKEYLGAMNNFFEACSNKIIITY